MKQIYFQSTFCILLLFLGLQSCTSATSDVNDLPGVEIDASRVNTDFLIYEDPIAGSLNTHKNNEYLAVSVKNESETRIRFPPEFVRIFIKNDDKWSEISNIMESPAVESYLPLNKEFPGGMIIPIVPSIPNMEEPGLIRIYFEGYTEDKNEKVGAYLDIELQP